MLAANDCSWSAEVHRIELWRLNWRIEADLYKRGNVLTHTQQRSVLCLQNSVSAVLPCMLERICCNEVSGALEVFGSGEKQFAVRWTNALALLNGLLITCLSLPSTAKYSWVRSIKGALLFTEKSAVCVLWTNKLIKIKTLP